MRLGLNIKLGTGVFAPSRRRQLILMPVLRM